MTAFFSSSWISFDKDWKPQLSIHMRSELSHCLGLGRKGWRLGFKFKETGFLAISVSDLTRNIMVRTFIMVFQHFCLHSCTENYPQKVEL